MVALIDYNNIFHNLSDLFLLRSTCPFKHFLVVFLIFITTLLISTSLVSVSFVNLISVTLKRAALCVTHPVPSLPQALHCPLPSSSSLSSFQRNFTPLKCQKALPFLNFTAICAFKMSLYDVKRFFLYFPYITDKYVGISSSKYSMKQAWLVGYRKSCRGLKYKQVQSYVQQPEAELKKLLDRITVPK